MTLVLWCILTFQFLIKQGFIWSLEINKSDEEFDTSNEKFDDDLDIEYDMTEE